MKNHLSLSLSPSVLLDLVDLEGQLKNMPVSTDEYATEYLTGRETYVVIRVDSELFYTRPKKNLPTELIWVYSALLVYVCYETSNDLVFKYNVWPRINSKVSASIEHLLP